MKRLIFKITVLLIAVSLCVSMFSACNQNKTADHATEYFEKKEDIETVRFELVMNHDEEQDLYTEHAIILGMGPDNDVIWTHITEEFPCGQNSNVEEVVCWKNQYIFCAGGTLIALDSETGEKLWENEEFNGYGIHYLEGKNGHLYLCAYQGPAFFEIDQGGNMLHKIESFEGYDWACDIQPAGDKIAVTMELSVYGDYQAGGHVFHVNLDDYSYELKSASEEKVSTSQASNRMMEDCVPLEVAVLDSSVFEEDKLYVFGSITPREAIRSITFFDTLDKVPVGHGVDVSEDKDKSVIAWMQLEPDSELFDLYIAANGNIVAPKDCTGLFAGYRNLESIHFNDCFDTSGVSNMSGMFMNCRSLQFLDVSGLDTSKVRSMEGMFCKVSSVEKLDLSNFNTENVNNMQEMFSCMGSLKELDVSSFNTSQVMFMDKMFDYCTQLTHLDLTSFKTEYVISMSGMFYRCMGLETLDISSFDVSAVLDMSFMFSGCSNLKELDLWNFNTKNVRSMESMFEACQSLIALDLSSFDTSSVAKMGFMFYRCSNLKHLDISNFDFSNFSDVEIPQMLFSGEYDDISISWPEEMGVKTVLPESVVRQEDQQQSLPGKWSNMAVSVGGTDTYPWIFDAPVQNCVELTMHYEIVSVDYGKIQGVYGLYRKTLNEKWERIGTFEVKDQSEVVKTFQFDKPISFTELAVAAPSGRNFSFSSRLWFDNWVLQD